MNKIAFPLILLLPLIAGCSDHLLFIEEEHIGLKAQFTASSSEPYDLDLGWHRGIVALLPQQAPDQNPPQSGAKAQLKGDLTTSSIEIASPTTSRQPAPPRETPANPAAGDSGDTAESGTVEIRPDPDELVSMYTTFTANVGLGDPVEVHHFLATGKAASLLMASDSELRQTLQALRAEKAQQNSEKSGQSLPQ